MLALLDVYKIISYVEQHFSVSVCLSLFACFNSRNVWQILTKFSTKLDRTQSLYFSFPTPGSKRVVETRVCKIGVTLTLLNRLTPNDPYMGGTAPQTSKCCILYIYSTNIGTEYFKRALYSPFFFSSKCSLFHNANLFGSCIIHILYTGCAKNKKKNNSGAKG